MELWEVSQYQWQINAVLRHCAAVPEALAQGDIPGGDDPHHRLAQRGTEGCSTVELGGQEGPVLRSVMRYGLVIVAGLALATGAAAYLSLR